MKGAAPQQACNVGSSLLRQVLQLPFDSLHGI
jgi:hypothetical protein